MVYKQHIVSDSPSLHNERYDLFKVWPTTNEGDHMLLTQKPLQTTYT